MKKIAYDSTKLDQLKIVEDSKCCLKVNAVITKEGVYPYPDGRAFKSKRELLKATRTAQNAKITIFDHPDSMVIMSQSQIYGTIEKPFFERDKIRATLNFDKYVTPPKFLHDIRNGRLKDVSIGFYYAPDPTPGKWNGERYDYVMRDIVIDHVAAGVLKGRCSFPTCGIGVDALMRRMSIQLDKVVKRGSQWCVVHCHPDGTVGGVIKCFGTKPEAEAMHRAIQAQQHGASKMTEPYESYFAKTDQDKRPPKDWWENCTSKAKSFASDPNRYCNWAWYEGGEKIKSSFGGAAESPGGMNEEMSLEELYYPERSKEFNECVSQRVSEGMTRGEAEAHCAAATKPEEEPTPEGPAGTSEHATGEAQEAETEFQKCVKAKTADGMSREEAEEACRGEQPVGEGDQLSDEETPLERCVKARMESEGETREQAEEYCKAELAGEHEAVDAMIERGNQLLRLRQQRDIQRRREARRYPLR